MHRMKTKMDVALREMDASSSVAHLPKFRLVQCATFMP
jgi:hypothetical protein